MSSHVKYTQTKNNVICLHSFIQLLPSSDIVIPSNQNPYELTTTKEWGLHFILSDNGNYNLDVEILRCGLLGFANVVIECGCLGC